MIDIYAFDAHSICALDIGLIQLHNSLVFIHLVDCFDFDLSLLKSNDKFCRSNRIHFVKASKFHLPMSNWIIITLIISSTVQCSFIEFAEMRMIQNANQIEREREKGKKRNYILYAVIANLVASVSKSQNKRNTK